MKLKLTVLFLLVCLISYTQSSIIFNADEKDFASVPDNTFFDFLDGDFAIETVFLMTKTSKEKQILLEYYDYKYNDGFSLYLSEKNNLAFLIGNQLFVVENYSFKEKECYQISVSIKNNNSIKIFINGEKVLDKETRINKQNLPKETILYIGGLPDKFFFNGEIDEIRLHKKSIDESQINQYLFSFYEDSIFNLGAYYNFDTITDQVIIDSSINNNDGWFALDGSVNIQDPVIEKANCVTKTGIINNEVYYCGELIYNQQPYLQCPDSSHFEEGIHIEDLLFSDSFGNIYCDLTTNNQNISRSNMSQPITETVGHFDLVYDDSFDNAYITIINQVFADIDSFLNHNDNPCGPTKQVKIEINKDNTLTTPTSNPLAVASTYNDALATSIRTARGRGWEGLNRGSYIGNFAGYIKINATFIDSNSFYLGFASDNNSDGIIDQQNASQLFDLYGVILHEIMHTLGFASRISQDGNGTSGIINYYDFLLYNDLQPFANQLTPYNWQGNLIPLNLINTACNTNSLNGLFVNSVPFLLTTDTSNNYNFSNLSHIDDNCVNSNGVHIMSPSVAPGAYERLTQDEVDILNDLKYSTNSQYGTNLISGNSNPNLQNFNTILQPTIALDACNPVIVDSCNTSVTYTFNDLGLNNNNIHDPSFNTTISDIFFIGSSDYENLINLQIVNNQITFTTDAFVNFTLGYTFTSPNNDTSNIGVIEFNILPCDTFADDFGCTQPIDPCNLICNSSLSCSFCNSISNTNLIDLFDFPNFIGGWYPSSSSPDYFSSNSTLFNGYFYCAPTEAVMTKVNTETNKNYLLSLLAKRVNNINVNSAVIDIKTSNLTETAYPDSTLWGLLNGSNSQNIITFNITNQGGNDSASFEHYMGCFQSNSDYDILLLKGGPSYFTNIEMIEDGFLSPSIMAQQVNVFCDNSNLTPIGADLCMPSGLTASYTWHNVTNGASIQLTNSDGSLTTEGQNAGVTIGNAEGSILNVPNTQSTYEIRRTLSSTYNVTLHNDCSVDSVQIDLVCTTPDPSYFITTWSVENSDPTITIPTHPSETYNYDVDWNGDGTFDVFGVTGDITYDYGTAGTYTVYIQGDFPRIYFTSNCVGCRTNSNLYNDKIISVNQWGDQIWTSMEGAFRYCRNLNGISIDTPNLSNVTSMSSMFIGAESYNQPMNNWDVSNVTDMGQMLYAASSFNQPLNNWDVSNVSNMNRLFAGATDFNQPLNNWNVSNVNDMSYMFSIATNFTQPLNNWNVANVNNMSLMFRGASDFNQPLDTWNVSNVTNMDQMFHWATNFNQPLNIWDVSSVTDMDYMFSQTTNFNQPLNNWNVNNVNSMKHMFSNAASFNQPLNNWNVSSVSNMHGMFYYALNFNQPIGNWDVSNVNVFYFFLEGANLSTANYDNLLTGWSQLNLQSNIDINVSSTYCVGAAARQNIISTFGWTIIDEGIDPTCRISNPLKLEEKNISIYPNPTTSKFNIEFKDQSISKFNLEVQNLQGITVIKSKNEKEIDISALNTGMYFIKVMTNKGEIYLNRIIKK